MHFKTFQTVQKENQIKYGLIKSFSKTIILKCIQHTMNENLLFLKDLLELSKTKIYKCMTAVSKNVYFDVSDDIVDKYNNKFHRTIKMKPIDVKCDSYAE